MTFALPAAKDNCNLGRGAGDPKWLADINAPANTGTKSAGSLPITGVATEFDNDANGAIKGYAKEFENGQSPAYDVSAQTKLMLWHTQCNAPNRIQVDSVANGGLRIRIYSGTGSPPANYREFYVGGNDTPFAASISGQYPLIIDLNDASHDALVGTFDNTQVTSFAVLTHRLNLAGSSTNWNYQGKLYILDTIKNSSSTPTFTGASNFAQAVSLLQGSDYTSKLGNWVRQIGSVVFMDMPFRIGDNATSTQFTDQGLVVVSPVANDSADPRVRVTTQAFRVYLNLRNNAADTATFSGTYIWGTRAAWDFGQADAAVVTFSSPTFQGMGAFALGSSITGPAIWDNVDAVVFVDTGVNVDGSTFKNPNGNHALEMTAGAMNIANMRFESYAGKHAILIDTAGTYQFDNVFFDQSGTNDIETTHASGVVTINVVNGGTVPTVTVTGAGTVVVNHDVTILVNAKDNDGANLQNARVYLKALDGTGPMPFKDPVTISRSGTVATVTHTAHGMKSGDKVKILGILDKTEDNNGVHTISVMDVDTYAYATTNSGSTSYTGLITSTWVALEGLTDVSGNISLDKTFSANQPVDGWVRKSSASPRFKTNPITGTIDSALGLTLGVKMILNE